MNLQKYFEFTETCVQYNKEVEQEYLQHGIWGEIGEFESILAKRLRGDEKYQDDSFYFCSLKSELGDIYWFAIRLLKLQEDAKGGVKEGKLVEGNDIGYYLNEAKLFLLKKQYRKVIRELDKIAQMLETTRHEILKENKGKLKERLKTDTIKSDGETVENRQIELEFDGLGDK